MSFYSQKQGVVKTVSKMSSPPPQQDIGDTNESLADSSLPIDFSNSSNIKETKKTSSVEKEVISANNGKLQVSRIILNPTLAKPYIKNPLDHEEELVGPF